MAADVARQGQQFQGDFQRNRVRRHVLWKGGSLGFGRGLLALLLGQLLAKLQIDAVRSLAQRDVQPRIRLLAQDERTVGKHVVVLVARHAEPPRVAAFRIVGATDECAELAELEAQAAVFAARTLSRAAVVTGLVGRKEMRSEIFVQRIEHLRDREILCAVDCAGKRTPEIAQDLFPIDSTTGDVVELLFHVGGKAVFDITSKEIAQEGDNQAATIFRRETPLFETNVIAILQHFQDRSVGGGAADAQLLHLLHQACFGVAWRRLGEVLFGSGVLQRCILTFIQRGQAPVAILAGLRIVAAFAIKLVEAVELHRAAIRPERDRLVRRGNIDRHLVEHGTFHAAGDRALPNQLVETQLIGIEDMCEFARSAEEIGGPDRLMRFLSVLRLRLEHPRRRRNVGVAEILRDQRPRTGDRLAAQGNAVRSHVGDETDGFAADVGAFIEPLRQLHRPACAEAELSARFLLQRRGRERRRGVSLHRLLFDAGDAVRARLDRRHGVVSH